MSNIYDVFNARKEGIAALEEGFEVAQELEGLDEVVFESFEDPCEVLDTIIEESANDYIELQGDLYVAELVLEGAIYDKFDETEIAGLMEAAEQSKFAKIQETIRRQWAKLTAWFKQTIQTIQNYFTSGEELVKKHKNDIPRLMRGQNATVKIYDYNPVGAACAKCDSMVANVKATASGEVKDVNGSKESILKACGATDRAGVAKSVKALFMNGDAPTETKVSALNPTLVMDYAGNRKAILDSINKSKANVDKEFKEILSTLKGSSNPNAKDNVAVFQFAIGVKNTIINAELACVKKGASDMKTVINKALGRNKKLSKSEIADKKAQYADKQLARKGVAVKESMNFEELSFDDEE